MDNRVDIERISLEVIQMSVSNAISKEVIASSNIRLESILDYTGRDMVFRLTANIASKKLSQIQYPVDWKEAFKERWFPEWLLKRYPVKYEIYDATVLYPSVEIPDHQHYVHLNRLNTNSY